MEGNRPTQNDSMEKDFKGSVIGERWAEKNGGKHLQHWTLCARKADDVISEYIQFGFGQYMMKYVCHCDTISEFRTNKEWTGGFLNKNTHNLRSIQLALYSSTAEESAAFFGTMFCHLKNSLVCHKMLTIRTEN